ncbi:MAG TPA: beta-galactosidase, partial [Candidatus Acidoferrum sp.]|nr:beta-galactosidase [Candidatus Acidoferrum sp.]
LDHHESFSIYMVHGGTTFGLWSGADQPFKPDTSSYDYDAPISEAGWPTEKFYETRQLLAEYLQPDETLFPVPATNAVTTFAPVTVTECAPLFANLPPAIHDTRPRTIEEYDQGYGCILYRTTIPPGPATTLRAKSVDDFGYVFLNGQTMGIMDRRSNLYRVALPARPKPETLDILVEAMGRVNFGPGIADCKGLSSPVTWSEDGNAVQPTNWEIFTLPLNARMLAGMHYAADKGTNAGPALWRATVNIKDPGDAFLDLRSWGKGVVWVNGHCLSRFWNIGPTQTAYIPGCWLRAGKNEILIFDLLGPEDPVVAGLERPILNEIHPEKSFTQAGPGGIAIKGQF